MKNGREKKKKKQITYYWMLGFSDHCFWTEYQCSAQAETYCLHFDKLDFLLSMVQMGSVACCLGLFYVDLDVVECWYPIEHRECSDKYWILGLSIDSYWPFFHLLQQMSK